MGDSPGSLRADPRDRYPASEHLDKELAGAAHDRYGRIDGLVNNAAIFADVRYAPFDEISVAEWDPAEYELLEYPFMDKVKLEDYL